MSESHVYSLTRKATTSLEAPLHPVCRAWASGLLSLSCGYFTIHRQPRSVPRTLLASDFWVSLVKAGVCEDGAGKRQQAAIQHHPPSRPQHECVLLQGSANPTPAQEIIFPHPGAYSQFRPMRLRNEDQNTSKHILISSSPCLILFMPERSAVFTLTKAACGSDT